MGGLCFMKQPMTGNLICLLKNIERHLVFYSQISFDVSRQTRQNGWVKRKKHHMRYFWTKTLSRRITHIKVLFIFNIYDVL